MKQTFFFLMLLLQITAVGQDKNISVISVERGNILYRGITNRLKVGVPGAKSYTVECYGKLDKVDTLGNYNLNVTGVAGKEVTMKINIILPDGNKIFEEKIFEIRKINEIMLTIDGDNCARCSIELTKEELLNARYELKIDDFMLREPILIESLSFYFPKKKIILNHTADLSETTKIQIEKLKQGDEIIVSGSTEYENRVIAAKVKIVNHH